MAEPPPGVDLEMVSHDAHYVGSPEHKERPSFAGWSRPRADASICDPSVGSPGQLTEWLRAAIRNGNVGAPWEGRFPRYVWHRIGETVYEARLVNRESGEYKGHALRPEQWPPELRGRRGE